MDTSEPTNGHPTEQGSGVDPSGGIQEHPRVEQERRDSGLSAIREARMVNRAIRNGWGGAKRWNTDATAEDMQKRMEETGGQLTLKERLILTTMNDAASQDARVRGIAVRNGLTMESQNQADELKQLPDMHLNIHKMADDEKKGRLQEIIEEAKAKAMRAGGAETNGTNGHVNGDGK